jgi:hypothetical protein
MGENKTPLLFVGLTFCIFFPLVVYVLYSYTFTAPLFYADDFHLLKTVVWGEATSSFVERWQLLVQQHNEHRIVFPRLLTWLSYLLLGSIQWPVLSLIGTLLWVGTVYVLWRVFEYIQAPVWMFISIPWILFQPHYYDNVTWTISILQQSVIVFWVSAMVYAVVMRSRWAIALAIVATFTHGNGIFGILIIILLLSLLRRWREVIVWVVFLLVLGVFYFYGFQKGQNADFLRSLSNPMQLLGAFFLFLGGASRVVSFSYPLAIGLGFILVSIGAIFLVRPLIRQVRLRNSLSFFEQTYIGIFLFVLLTAALVSISRSWAGLESITASRYAHYSPYLACWIYLVVLYYVPAIRRFVAGLVLLLAIPYWFLAYWGTHQEIQFRYDWLRADQANWCNHAIFLQYPSSFNYNIRDVYQAATQTGICSATIPEEFLTEEELNQVVPLKTSFFQTTDQDASGSYTRKWLRIEGTSLTASLRFIGLRSQEGAVYWLPIRRGRVSYGRLWRDRTLFEAKVSTEVLLENLPKGTYELLALESKKLVVTTQSVEIQ